jgi:hypothetical protein
MMVRCRAVYKKLVHYIEMYLVRGNKAVHTVKFGDSFVHVFQHDAYSIIEFKERVNIRLQRVEMTPE